MKKFATILAMCLASIVAIGQNVVFDTTFVQLSPDSVTYVRHSEVRYEDGRTVKEDAPMTSAELTQYYEREINGLGDRVSEVAIQALNRRQAGRTMIQNSKAIKGITGADILDSIGFKVYDELLKYDWNIALRDTAFSATFSRAKNNFKVTINGTALNVLFLNKRWLQVQDFYAKGIDLDLFLWKGFYVSPDYSVVLQAKNAKSASRSVGPPPSTKTTVTSPGKKTVTSRRKKTTKQ